MTGEQERAERAKKARRLKEDGLSQREIAKKLGVTVATVNRDLNPDVKRKAQEASRLGKQNVRPRMAAAEKRLDDLATTVTDLSDRLAALEDAATLKKGARLGSPSPRTKQAVERVRRLARSQAPPESRAK